MKIKVEFYSALRTEITNTHELVVEVSPGATIQNLLDELFLQFPKLKDWDKQLLLAAGMDYVEREHVLVENDIISVMPPVQGG